MKTPKTTMLALALCAGGVVSCAPASTPEQQVREVIAAGEAAAESRDHLALMTLGTVARVADSRETDASGAKRLDLAANLHSIELELQREGDHWKVTRAEWDSLVGS